MNTVRYEKMFMDAVNELSLSERYGAFLKHRPEFLQRMLSIFCLIVERKEARELLIRLENYDRVTFLHIVDMYLLSGLFGDIENLAFLRGALFHDIGKLDVPVEILQKKGRLTAEEYEVMKTHTIYGSEILENLGYGFESLLARSHHELLDGSGYPDNLTNIEIPEVIRLICMLDVYSALTLERPYKPPFTNDEALLILLEQDKKYDLELMQRIIEDFKNANVKKRL